MSKHTPGPWKWERVKTSCGVCFRVGPLSITADKPNHACIYADYPGQMALELGEANARLIAAAPELLGALKWFIADIDGTHTSMIDFDANVARSRAAIAKAEGRT